MLSHPASAVAARYGSRPAALLELGDAPGRSAPVVRWITPLLWRFCELEGLDPSKLMRPLVMVRMFPWERAVAIPRAEVAAPGLATDRPDGEPVYLHADRTLHLRSRRGEDAAVRLRSGRVELSLRTERGCLWSHGHGALIFLETRPPETVLVAMTGRPVDELVDHPLLDGAGYVVRRARRHGDVGARLLLRIGQGDERGRRPVR